MKGSFHVFMKRGPMLRHTKGLVLLFTVLLASAIFASSVAGESKKDCGCPVNKKLKQNICKKCCNTDLKFEQAIRDRFQNGFSNWNQGYEAWLEWCDTLYEPDAYYNVYGQRLTLQQYKDMMGQFFSVFDIQLGALDNVIVEGEWGAIRYTVYVTNKYTGEETELKTMEIVHFKKNPEPIGARVIEGWALSDKPLSAE